MVEDIEKCVLSTRLARKFLNIVENKHIYTLIEVDEVRDILLYSGCLELRLELAHSYIENLKLRVTHANLVSDSLRNMGLAKT